MDIYHDAIILCIHGPRRTFLKMNYWCKLIHVCVDLDTQRFRHSVASVSLVKVVKVTSVSLTVRIRCIHLLVSGLR